MFDMTVEILNRFAKDRESTITLHNRAIEGITDKDYEFAIHHKLIVDTKRKELD